MKRWAIHIKEWGKAFLWAFLVAWVIRTFLLQGAFIPTQSMEGTLLPGDFIFISKWNYGARLPITPLAVPFVHQHFPFTESVPCYLSWPQLPYWRMPGTDEIRRNDVVVFNYPMETEAPVDRRTLYVKRCMALPGDTVELREKRVWINGQITPLLPHLQFTRHIKAAAPLDQKWLDSLGIRDGGLVSNILDYEFPLSDSMAAYFSRQASISKVSLRMDAPGDYQAHIFPHSRNYPYNQDFWGPVRVPRAGDVVVLNDTNRVWYERIIRQYEGHTFEFRNGKSYIDGAEQSTYTLTQNYYFVLGDNRDNSADSRAWGFVPENHIVGKAWMVFFSYDPFPEHGGVRWSRLFHWVHD